MRPAASATAEKLNYDLSCPSCTKVWQVGVVAAAGAVPFVKQHRCERCRVWWLIAYRVAIAPEVGITTTLIGIERMLGRDSGSFRDTLNRIAGLTEDEVELFVLVAQRASA